MYAEVDYEKLPINKNKKNKINVFVYRISKSKNHNLLIAGCCDIFYKTLYKVANEKKYRIKIFTILLNYFVFLQTPIALKNARLAVKILSPIIELVFDFIPHSLWVINVSIVFFNIFKNSSAFLFNNSV